MMFFKTNSRIVDRSCYEKERIVCSPTSIAHLVPAELFSSQIIGLHFCQTKIGRIKRVF